MQHLLRALKLLGYVLRLVDKPPRKHRWDDIKKRHQRATETA